MAAATVSTANVLITAVEHPLRNPNYRLWLIGGTKTEAHIGQSLWLRELQRRQDGPPPSVDLAKERKAGEIIQQAVSGGLVTAVHDVSDGGLLVAIAEMALAGGIGAVVDPNWIGDWKGSTFVTDTDQTKRTVAAELFGEDQGRYIVAVADPEDYRIIEAAKEAGVPTAWLGVCGGQSIFVGDGPGAFNVAEILIADLRAAHEGFFPKLMGSELPPEF